MFVEPRGLEPLTPCLQSVGRTIVAQCLCCRGCSQALPRTLKLRPLLQVAAAGRLSVWHCSAARSGRAYRGGRSPSAGRAALGGDPGRPGLRRLPRRVPTGEDHGGEAATLDVSAAGGPHCSALDPAAPAYEGPAGDWHHPGHTVSLLRSDEDKAQRGLLTVVESLVEDLRYEGDPTVYGEALVAGVHVTAGVPLPGVPVEVKLHLQDRRWENVNDAYGRRRSRSSTRPASPPPRRGPA